MTSIAIRILHAPGNPERDRMHAVLMRKLTQEGINHPEIHSVATVFGEIEHDVPPAQRNCWKYAKRSWEHGVQSGATHLCQLNDDVFPSDGFIDALAQVAKAIPYKLVGLFRDEQSPAALTAAVLGHRYFRSHGGVVGPAWIAPVSQVRRVLEYSDACMGDDFIHDDVRWNLFHWSQNVKHLWFTTPSLVQHVGSSTSLMGHKDVKAAVWIPSVEALDFSIVPEDPLYEGGNYRLPEKQADVVVRSDRCLSGLLKG